MPSRSISHEKKPACRQRAQIWPSPRYSLMRLSFREADVDPKHSIFKCGMPVIRPILSPVHSILNYAFRPVPTHFERVSFLRFVQIPPTWRSNLFKSQSTEHARILSVLSHCKPHERPNGIRPAKGSLGQRPTHPPIVLTTQITAPIGKRCQQIAKWDLFPGIDDVAFCAICGFGKSIRAGGHGAVDTALPSRGD